MGKDHRRPLRRLVVSCLVYRLRAVRPEYLILQRDRNSRLFPERWCTPSGGVESKDHPPGTAIEAALEAAARREVFEESGLYVGPLEYRGSFEFEHPDGGVVAGHRFAAPHVRGTVRIESEVFLDHAWITAAAVGRYPFINGIAEEIVSFDRSRHWTFA